jgi:hypothetical protein
MTEQNIDKGRCKHNFCYLLLNYFLVMGRLLFVGFLNLLLCGIVFYQPPYSSVQYLHFVLVHMCKKYGRIRSHELRQQKGSLKVVTNEKGEAVGDVLTIIW